ncbi:hypothetical protein [Treponema sp.]|uniref:hypothetical protein n=1 Tax=Treponema sp. TaxID=166 RepID=UPI0025D54FE1|nr:hypothetical protein [Treponema sp.]MCR5218672.1 hypothetical protein [Treponema sp.]
MDKVDFLNRELNKRYGSVKRARGNFLYTARGVRLTDLYREEGRALLGWPSQESAVTVFKNVLSRGINGSYSTDFSYGMDKAVSLLFNSSRKCIFFAFKEDARNFAEKEFKDSFAWYKPWQGESIDTQKDCILFEPVFPWAQSIYAACLPCEWEGDREEKPFRSINVSAPLKAAMTRSVYNLLKALQTWQEKDWFLYDVYLKPYFTRKGPWLFPKVAEKDYEAFVLHCLDCHLVISPDYNIPSAVPFGAEKGVFELLKKNPFGGL